jgi:hypothetical protein
MFFYSNDIVGIKSKKIKNRGELILLGGFIACFFVSILLFLFSYLIWNKKELSLIAGFNEETFKGDKNKLARAAGIFLVVTGVLTLLLPFGLEFIGSAAGTIFSIVIIVGTIGLIIYINTMGKKNIMR